MTSTRQTSSDLGGFLRAPGIPLWTTIFAGVLFLVGCAIGIPAILGQGADIEPLVNASIGGRSLGIGVAAGLAVFLRSPSAYLVVFVGSVVRDIGDLVTELSRTDPSTGILG